MINTIYNLLNTIEEIETMEHLEQIKDLQYDLSYLQYTRLCNDLQAVLDMLECGVYE